MTNTYTNLYKIFLPLFISLLGWSNPLAAQGWERFYTGDQIAPEMGTAIVATPDGNYVVAGHSNVDYGTANFKYFLIKLDINGNEQWAHFYTDLAQATVTDMVLATDGGLLLSVNSDTACYLVKTDADGNHEWTKDYALPGKNTWIRGLINTADGGYAFTGAEILPGSYADARITKLDEQGEIEWDTSYHAESPPIFQTTAYARTLTETDDGDFLVAGLTTWGSGDSLMCLKYDAAGQFIWKNAIRFDDTNSTVGYSIFGKSDGTIDIFTLGGYMVKLDNQGDTLWTKDVSSGIWTHVYDVVEVGNDYVMTGDIRTSTSNPDQGVLLSRIDSVGNVIWFRNQNPRVDEDYGQALVQTADEGFMVTGYTWDKFDAYVMKSDSMGIVYTNHVEGQVVWDELDDCLLDPADVPLEKWLVQAVSATGSLSTTTDANGHYSMPIDTGDYTLSTTPLYFYMSPCENDITISLPDFNMADTVDFIWQDTLQCPFMQVDVSNFNFRPCMPSFISLKYCNYGTTTAEGAYVEVMLDSNLLVDSTSIPIASQNGQTYTFDLGDVTPLECGSIRIYTTVECDLDLVGLSLCTEAHIYPDTVCGDAATYVGALIEANALCEDSIVKLELENVGQGDLMDALDYIVIEDAVLLMGEEYNDLISGEKRSMTFAANGATYAIISQQVPVAPFNNTPIAIIEGCGDNGNGSISTGFMNQFAYADNYPWMDLDCRTVTNGYDPNDKQSFPQGYGNQHYIEPNGEIEYLIRFQNTGTDTAFNIVVRDTLSPLLDLTGLQVGAASHDMDYRIYGENILEFTFHNIQLPDSTTNQLGSNGFVEFKIPQQKDLSPGTVIYNSAAIFFDFNPPIITNETWLTIEEEFIIVLPNKEPLREGVEVAVYPNPFYGKAIFEINGIGINEGVFEIYNAQGQLLRRENFNGHRFEFERAALLGGVYFYKILAQEKGAIAAGAVMVK